jgi:hypothetical protein
MLAPRSRQMQLSVPQFCNSSPSPLDIKVIYDKKILYDFSHMFEMTTLQSALMYIVIPRPELDNRVA